MYGKYTYTPVEATEVIITKIDPEYICIAKIIKDVSFRTFKSIFNYLINTKNVCFEFYDDEDDSEKINNQLEFEDFLTNTRLEDIYGFSFFFTEEQIDPELKSMCEAIEYYMSESVSEYIENKTDTGEMIDIKNCNKGVSTGGGNKKQTKIGIVYKNNTYRPYICKKEKEIYIIVDNIKKYPKYPFKFKNIKT